MAAKLVCDACGYTMDAAEDIEMGRAPVPTHCGQPMRLERE